MNSTSGDNADCSTSRAEDMRVSGRIRNKCNGEGIARARIVLSIDGTELAVLFTNETGHFLASDEEVYVGDALTCLVEKQGFYPYEETLEVTEEIVRNDIYLLPPKPPCSPIRIALSIGLILMTTISLGAGVTKYIDGRKTLPNIAITDLKAKVSNGKLIITYALATEGGKVKPFMIGILVTKPPQLRWETKWKAPSSLLKQLNATGRGKPPEPRAFDIPFSEEGKYSVNLSVDTENAIREQNETDNSNSATFVFAEEQHMAPTPEPIPGHVPIKTKPKPETKPEVKPKPPTAYVKFPDTKSDYFIVDKTDNCL